MKNHKINSFSDKQTYEIISDKISAVNNKVRFSILEILSEIERINQSGNVTKKGPLYSREINLILLEEYNIDITPQMLGQHLKQLENAGLIEEIYVKKEIPNKVGPRTVKAFKLNSSAFKDLFLDIDIFRYELLSLFKLYENHKRYEDNSHCILTILNGQDKGKTFKINKNEIILVGRISDYSLNELASFTILLNNSYQKVNPISQPHLKIFYHENKWCIIDEYSKNGTYMDEKLVEKNKVTLLRNNSFLRLSKGTDGVVFYCTY